VALHVSLLAVDQKGACHDARRRACSYRRARAARHRRGALQRGVRAARGGVRASLSACVVALLQATMAMPRVPASIALYETADKLLTKGRFASAVEKFREAAAAAGQELAAEDCLVVAYLRVAQAGALISSTAAPTMADAAKDEARRAARSVLTPQFMSTLTRRMAACSLLPGSCRPAEVEWFQVFEGHRALQSGRNAEVARACGVAAGPTVGFDAYMLAAGFLLSGLDPVRQVTPCDMPREMQLSHAVFIATAFVVMAHPQKLPRFVVPGDEGVFLSTSERLLVHLARLTLVEGRIVSNHLDLQAMSLLVEAWRRVELSGAVAMRRLDEAEIDLAASCDACLSAAAADVAARGLRECALAGCGAREVHVAQFKRCSACRTVFYCCREHQVADWPAHKTACKAARKTSSK
jgi:hypothetical protein